MNWKVRLLLLLVCAVPAFTGYPVNRYDAVVVEGLTHAWAVYFIATNALVMGICGRRRYGRILTATVLVTLPVIASGSLISFAASLFAADVDSAQAKYSAHYLRLCVTMLTVVPLALGLVATIPLQAFEQQLLQDRQGVTLFQKRVLMALRVFNHIVYYVIPGVLEVVREERQFAALEIGFAGADKRGGRFRQVALILRRLTHVAGEGICAAVQNIPVWAVEIARLPGRRVDGMKERSR